MVIILSYRNNHARVSGNSSTTAKKCKQQNESKNGHQSNHSIAQNFYILNIPKLSFSSITSEFGLYLPILSQSSAK